jgi:MFS family permease
VTTLGVPPVGAAVAPPRRWYQIDLGGAPAFPLFILFGLNLVDEFDRIAFAALTPEIRDAFGLGDSAIVAIGAISAVFILAGALPFGYLGDRYPRTRIAGIAALVWGSMALLTGAAWIVPVLFIARLGSGIARTSNEVVHPSLLVDLYPPEVQPRAFQLHRLATPLSAGAGLLAGGIAALLGWRWTFVVLSIPTFVLLTLLLRLREPRRGGTINPALLEDDAEQAPPVSFGEARRTLFRVRTLRRCWVGGFLLGSALIANAQLLSLFFEQVHGFGPLGRGTVQFANGAGLVVGILVGARAAGKATATGRFRDLTYVVAGSFLVSAAGLVLMAVTPWAPVAVGVVFLLGIGLGVYQPAYYPLVARIVPAGIRTQAYGWTLLFAGLGALVAIPLARFGENNSYRWAFVIFAGVILVGAAVIASARRGVDGDIERADAALLA